MASERSLLLTACRTFLPLFILIIELDVSLQQHCHQKNDDEQIGFALTNAVHKIVTTGSYALCLLECSNNVKCMSINFHTTTNKCELNTQTKDSRPELYEERHNSIYSTNFDSRLPAQKGKKNFPAKSCLDILVSGGSVGTGEYWLDPKNIGEAIKAYCDMTTDGGGWTIIKRTILKQSSVPKDEDFSSYNVISAYKKNYKNVIPTVAAMMDILQKMGFHQIHFYCHKQAVGRVVSIMTKNNTAGQQVVRYFTENNFQGFPKACWSFDTLPEDTSILAQNCGSWGKDSNGKVKINRWGNYFFDGAKRMPYRAFAIETAYQKGFGLRNSGENVESGCDDNFDIRNLNINDTWQISVR